MLAQFRSSLAEQHFDVEGVDNAAVGRDSAFDIHSVDAIRFMSSVVGASSSVRNILRDGLRLDFRVMPGPYSEQNNRSAVSDLNFVRNKVATWLAAGYVERLSEPAFCCNPLSVAEKLDVFSDELKKRLVIDMSRHVNLCIADTPVKLDDLTQAEQVLELGDYMQAFDLKNQFFHVKLHPSMKNFFGFAVEEEDGSVSYYQFKILAYGCKQAVAVVTKLLKPVKSFLHSLGVRLTLYIDDGRVVASSSTETRFKFGLSLLCIQLAGGMCSGIKRQRILRNLCII